MTLEEKIDLLGGVNGFDVRGVPRHRRAVVGDRQMVPSACVD